MIVRILKCSILLGSFIVPKTKPLLWMWWMCNTTQLHVQHQNIYLQKWKHEHAVWYNRNIWLPFFLWFSRKLFISCTDSSTAAILLLCCLFLWIATLLPVKAHNMKMPRKISRVGRLKMLPDFQGPSFLGWAACKLDKGLLRDAASVILYQEEVTFSMMVLPLSNPWPYKWPHQFTGSSSRTALEWCLCCWCPRNSHNVPRNSVWVLNVFYFINFLLIFTLCLREKYDCLALISWHITALLNNYNNSSINHTMCIFLAFPANQNPENI